MGKPWRDRGGNHLVRHARRKHWAWGHPGSLADRLRYLSSTASRQALAKAGLKVREEAAFQGGEGYLMFGTPELALATVARIAEQIYHPAPGPIEDPVYADPDFAAHGLKYSDIEVLRAVVASLDPGTWLDRAAHTKRPDRREALASEISDFSPRHGVTRLTLEAAILRLEIDASLRMLDEIFPAASDKDEDQDYAEPAAPRGTTAYAREHREIFEPMRRLFGMVREIAVAVTHDVGAFG